MRDRALAPQARGGDRKQAGCSTSMVPSKNRQNEGQALVSGGSTAGQMLLQWNCRHECRGFWLCRELPVCTRLVPCLQRWAGAYVVDGGKTWRLKWSSGFLWGQKVTPADGPSGAS